MRIGGWRPAGLRQQPRPLRREARRARLPGSAALSERWNTAFPLRATRAQGPYRNQTDPFDLRCVFDNYSTHIFVDRHHPSYVESEAVPGFTLSAQIPLGRFFVEPDTGYRLELNSDLSERRQRLVYRIGLGYEAHEYFRIHAGGGLIHTFHSIGGPKELDPLAFLGVSVLR